MGNALQASRKRAAKGQPATAACLANSGAVLSQIHKVLVDTTQEMQAAQLDQ